MTRFKLVFSEAVRSIGANLSTSIAATMTVLIGMFLLGLSIALGSWVVSWSDHVKSQLEVKVFFVDGVDAEAGQRGRHATSASDDADQGVPVRLEDRGAEADAEEVPAADREPALEPAARPRSR